MRSTEAFESLDRRLAQLSAIVSFAESKLGRPFFVPIEANVGEYRFAQAGHLHYCILHSARVVSGLRAAVHVARAGFHHDTIVILRVVAENAARLHFVSTHAGRKEAEDVVAPYFQDHTRRQGERLKYSGPTHGALLDQIGRRTHEELERLAAIDPTIEVRTPKEISEQHRYVYSVFSNYIHNRYPEAMDLYSGLPPRINLGPVLNEPKLLETALMIEVVSEGAELDVRIFFRELLRADESWPDAIRRWVGEP
jgi:hypothetical protein